MILPVVACLLLAGVLVWQIHGANATVDLIQQSDQKIALATLIEKLVVDEETGLRGYQVTSDQRFLKPYRDAEVPLQKALGDLSIDRKSRADRPRSNSSPMSTRPGTMASPNHSSTPSKLAATP